MSSQPSPTRHAAAGRTANPLAPVLLAAIVVVAGCATAGPTAPPGSPAVSSTAASLPAEPPAASLTAVGGTPVVGALGGYTWQGAGSDAPWIIVPAEQAVPGAGPYRVAFDPAVAATSWTAAWAPIVDGHAGDVAGHEQGTDADVSFAGPGSDGPWTLKLEVAFGAAGRAAWFWLLRPGP